MLVSKANFNDEVQKLIKYWNEYTPDKAAEDNLKLSESITKYRSECVLLDFKKNS